MQAKIGKLAGKVWKLLREKEEVEITRIPRMVDETTVMAYQAIGWLAREEKLRYRKKGDKVYVSLTPHEMNQK